MPPIGFSKSPVFTPYYLEGRCPECKKNEEELNEIARIVQGAVKVGKIDAKLLPSVKISKNPTYIFTRSDNSKRHKVYPK